MCFYRTCKILKKKWRLYLAKPTHSIAVSVPRYRKIQSQLVEGSRPHSFHLTSTAMWYRHSIAFSVTDSNKMVCMCEWIEFLWNTYAKHASWKKKGCRSFIEKNPASIVPCKRTIHRTVAKIFNDRVGSS